MKARYLPYFVIPLYILACAKKPKLEARRESYGVEPTRLKLISYGEEKPSLVGHDESAWAMNRRDDFKVTF